MVIGWIFFIISLVLFAGIYCFDLPSEVSGAFGVMLVPLGAGCGLCISNIQKWRREEKKENEKG